MAKVKNQSTFIYTLSNPITKEVRYIGKTVNIKDRYRQHIGKRLLDNSHKNNWISSLIKEGCKEEGYILIPPNKYVVPVDTRRLKGWDKERVDQYIFDIKNATKKDK